MLADARLWTEISSLLTCAGNHALTVQLTPHYLKFSKTGEEGYGHRTHATVPVLRKHSTVAAVVATEDGFYSVLNNRVASGSDTLHSETRDQSEHLRKILKRILSI